MDSQMQGIQKLSTSNRVAPFRAEWTDKSKAGACRKYAPRLLRTLKQRGHIKRVSDRAGMLRLLESLLVNLSFHAGMNRRVLVSRSTANNNRLPSILEGMEAIGLVRQRIAPRDPHGGVTTEVEALKPLLVRTDKITAAEILAERLDVVELRDKKGKPLPVPERLVRAASPAIKRLNRILRGTVIEVAGTHYPAPQYYRVFNLDDEHGGRWYCAEIQNQSKADRADMRINGDAVEEPDFEALHPRMVYNLEGMEWPAELDPYAIPGVDRSLAKKLFMCLLNDHSIKSARHHLKIRQKPAMVRAYHDFRDEVKAWRTGSRTERPMRPARLWAGFEPLDASIDVDASIDAFLDTHHAIAPAFDSPGQALRLQWHDARIAERVVAEHVKRLRPVLPVHDSFIVQAHHADELRGIMAAAYREEMGFDCPIG